MYVTIPEVRTIKFTGSKASLDDVTNMDSAGNTQEWLATIIDAGECDFDFNMVPGDANQGNVLADFNGQVKNYWKVTLPGAGGAFSFQAYVTSADASLEPTKAATRSCKLKITGVLAFA